MATQKTTDPAAAGYHAWIKETPAGIDRRVHEKRWAGEGHVGAFLLQFGCTVAVQIAVWGFFLLWALRMAHSG